MAEVTFSSRAYCKVILHAAKYPHCAINGLLLAKQKSKSDNKSSELVIEDAIPLFHICLHVSPMAEVALTLVDQYASQQGLVIAGYYLANELINDMSTDKPAHRIADKIAENYHSAIMTVIDNREINLGMQTNPLRVFQHLDGKWKVKDSADVILENEEALLETIYTLLRDEEYRNLIDFDNHLDNVSLNWKNTELNKTIKQVMAKQQ
ncbi:ER membrane protein complex subunit 8/9 homolog [Venturia canescens]|uniref:ER membrane protein complex subunit 8/9 homolog n=1 Tax=Venturia canescens TaxID=32260 RepID=UPI001C9D096D|nr:ER membrane protein complex subunit 8/9 homolog [Venturia canescens]